MEMDMDKSEDELELERLVFGDSADIRERLRGKTDKDVVSKTDLEHLEDDQVLNTPLRPSAYSNSSSLSILARNRTLKWGMKVTETRRMKQIV
jgi:hypothetical protein